MLTSPIYLRWALLFCSVGVISVTVVFELRSFLTDIKIPSEDETDLKDSWIVTQQQTERNLDDLIYLHGLVQKYKSEMQGNSDMESDVSKFQDYFSNFRSVTKEFSSAVQQSLIVTLINENRKDKNIVNNHVDIAGLGLHIKKLTTQFNEGPYGLTFEQKMRSDFSRLFEFLFFLEVFETRGELFNTRETAILQKYGEISLENFSELQEEGSFLKSKIADKELMSFLESKGKLEVAQKLQWYFERTQINVCDKCLECPPCSTQQCQHQDQVHKGSKSPEETLKMNSEENDLPVKNSDPLNMSNFFDVIIYAFNFCAVFSLYGFTLSSFDHHMPQDTQTTVLFGTSYFFVCFISANYVTYVVKLLPFYEWIYSILYIAVIGTFCGSMYGTYITFRLMWKQWRKSLKENISGLRKHKRKYNTSGQDVYLH